MSFILIAKLQQSQRALRKEESDLFSVRDSRVQGLLQKTKKK